MTTRIGRVAQIRTGRKRGTSFVARLAAAALLLATEASAGNEDSFFLSNTAALSGGAVVAVTDDVGAIWYNPAGLGANERDRLDLSASAFVLRDRRWPSGVRAVLPDRVVSKDVEGQELSTVPSAVGAVHQLGDGVSLGLGLFTVEQDSLTMGADVQSQSSAGSDLVLTAETSTGRARYQAGAAIGWEVSRGLRVGTGLFGVYESVDHRRYFLADVTPAPGTDAARASVMGQITTRPIMVGGEMTLGMQWQMTDTLAVGALARSPRFRLARFGTTGGDSFVAVSGGMTPPQQVVASEQVHLDGGLGLVTAGRYGAGIAWRRKGAFVDAEVDYGAPLSREGPDRKSTFNARLGGILETSERLRVGLGVFTDRNAERPDRELFATDVDYYGVAGGAELRTPVTLDASERSPDGTLVFATTLAVRYAIGVGTVRPTVFDFSALSGANAGAPTDVLYHEASVHVGQGVQF